MGMEEELLPHRNSIEMDTIEEERRLAYVGITRAKQNLVMTLAKQRKQYGEVVDCAPSRFIDELPQEDVEYEGDHEASKPNRTKGKAALADLKSLFD